MQSGAGAEALSPQPRDRHGPTGSLTPTPQSPKWARAQGGMHAARSARSRSKSPQGGFRNPNLGQPAPSSPTAGPSPVCLTGNWSAYATTPHAMCGASFFTYWSFSYSAGRSSSVTLMVSVLSPLRTSSETVSPTLYFWISWLSELVAVILSPFTEIMMSSA